MLKDKKMLTVSFVLVIAVIIILTYITINNKKGSTKENNNVEQNTNMQQQEKNENKNISNIKGLEIIVLREGEGNPVKSGDSIAMNYTGTLSDGTIFDSNVDPKFNHVEPFMFVLGSGQVIKGWDMGIEGMKLGEKRKLTIAPEYGYGANGAGGVIPPNATLIFEVELIGIKQ